MGGWKTIYAWRSVGHLPRNLWSIFQQSMFDYRRVMGISVASFSMGCWDWKECYVEYCQWDHFFCWQVPESLGMIPLTTKARLEFLHSEQWPAHYGWRWCRADFLGCEDAGLKTWTPKYGWFSSIFLGKMPQIMPRSYKVEIGMLLEYSFF